MPSSPSPPQESNVPRIEDKARKPLGVLPRNAQAWVLVGVAAIMIMEKMIWMLAEAKLYDNEYNPTSLAPRKC